MVILIDTNIILDYFVLRQPFADNACDILTLCFKEKCNGYIAAHSVSNIFYILRKQFSVSKRKELLIDLCEFIEVAGIQKKQVIDALTDEDFNDFEDRLQVECARLINADYIITRNISDFLSSPIPAILPEDFLQKMAVN
ncbi:MAG: PIN domain-containing protein [Treponema sp.]|nr:PIN domain-containing protein [Treponema sp.]MCL2252381.1 PIN domain-containing protein [Treponema sp.]